MDRNKLDPGGPTLAEVLAAADVPLYGQGYQSPALGGDEIYDTSDVSRIAAYQKAAKDRALNDALKNLAITAMAPWATAGAAAARRAAPLPSPLAESTADKIARYGRATALHHRGEVKRDNADWWHGVAAFPAFTAATVGTGMAGWPTTSSILSSGALMTNPWGMLMKPHYDHIRDVATYLRGMQLREARKQPMPDNSGTTLYSAPPFANVLGGNQEQ